MAEPTQADRTKALELATDSQTATWRADAIAQELAAQREQLLHDSRAVLFETQSTVEELKAEKLVLIAHLQNRRRETLVALRANVSGGADYWRWQGHAEMSRQLLERFGAEVPR